MGIQSSDAPRTFAVSDVSVARHPHKTVAQKHLLERVTGGRVEACSGIASQVLSLGPGNQLQKAAGIAFTDHYPLALSPDAIWLAVAQGFASHVNKNAEALRPVFVRHAGRFQITVRRDEFRHGSPDNEWPRVFGEFSKGIRDTIGKPLHGILASDFTTTGAVERAASEVVLMGAMRNYFDYHVRTMCGIPSVRLSGSVDDWEKVLGKAIALRKIFGVVPEELRPEFWFGPLLQVLEGFVQAARGDVDVAWWRSMYKFDDSSGGPYVSGWLTWLFPYLERGEQNQYVGKLVQGPFAGLGDGDFPSSISRVPFVWDYFGKQLRYEFLAGHTGVVQDPRSLEVRPILGWAVRMDVNVEQPS